TRSGAMRGWLMSCVVIAGCGYPALPKIGGGSNGMSDDAAIDGPGNGSGDGSSGATDCFAHWLDHTVSLGAPTEVSELSSGGNERDPWVSNDGRRMYFSRDQGTPDTSDIFFTSRDSTAQAFSSPTPVVNLNSSGHEGRVWLTPDELTLAI